MRAIAARSHPGPFGGQHSYSRDTLDRWIRRYRRGGFEALVPSVRQPSTRVDGEVLELAVALKKENPTRTVAQVARILRASSGYSPSESTLLRLFHRHELIGPAAGVGPAVFGRFEADNPNQRWVGDALHGPRIGGRKAFLFAFLDDHSRLAVGYRFGFAEDTVRLAAALEPALAARGVPQSAYVDNGSAFVDAWLLRACAKLGIRLVHSTPHRPQGRGKIERFFRTVPHNMAPHRLRHFLFTWLKTQGIDDALIQPYSGHTSRQSLEIYSKLALTDAQDWRASQISDSGPNKVRSEMEEDSCGRSGASSVRSLRLKQCD